MTKRTMTSRVRLGNASAHDPAWREGQSATQRDLIGVATARDRWHSHESLLYVEGVDREPAASTPGLCCRA